MSNSKKLEWGTKLGHVAQQLATAQREESGQPDYRRTEVKRITDEQTVAEARSIAVEISEELERLRVFTETLTELQQSMRKVSGL